MAFFCVSVDLYNVWLNRKRLDPSVCSVYHLSSVVMVEENLASRGDAVRTELGVLWAFMCLCFKVSFNVESKTFWVHFPFSVTLTRCILCTGLLSTVPGSFNRACFPNITYWWLKKYWFTDLHRSSKCWHIHYKYWKLTFVNFTIYLIRKVFKDWEADKLRMADTSFPGFKSLLESSDYFIGNKYSQLFSMKWQTHFIHFWENVAEYCTLNNRRLSVILSDWMELHGKGSKFSSRFNRVHKCFSWRQSPCFDM